ncbi:MAG: precorrin-3B C(17)-methyltransferase [Nitrospirae bacterium]|nr:precorrin-3B C(17)-methyltransferase [Nitrospirota bacterium]
MRTGGTDIGGGKKAARAKDEIEEHDGSRGGGRLAVVGIGPGSELDMTPRARAAIENSDTVVGYTTYIKLVRPMLAGQEVVSTGMKSEAERCLDAVRLAVSGKRVALISSGDSGVYGMAGLTLEIMKEEGAESLPFEVIPGVPAVCSSAASLGAPLMHDFAVISLSDLLTPLELIFKRLEAAASADFVIALYNPRSKGRPGYLEEACKVIMKHRSGTTPVGIVKDSRRDGEKVIVTTLAGLPVEEVDMTTMVIVGNSQTYRFMDYLVTPRGYKGKRF